MMTPFPSTSHVGLDVAKLTLQVDLAGRSLALANTPAGHRALLTYLHRFQARTSRPVHVVCEGNLATVGGVTSGIDLALRVVERYAGRGQAQAVADIIEHQGTG